MRSDGGRQSPSNHAIAVINLLSGPVPTQRCNLSPQRLRDRPENGKAERKRRLPEQCELVGRIRRQSSYLEFSPACVCVQVFMCVGCVCVHACGCVFGLPVSVCVCLQASCLSDCLNVWTRVRVYECVSTPGSFRQNSPPISCVPGKRKKRVVGNRATRCAFPSLSHTNCSFNTL